jgi:PilX N-terminal
MRSHWNDLRKITTGRRQSSRPTKNSAHGAALIVTLILLALLSAISVAMVLMVSSDTLINGYYRNYRGSFYAADSGINAVVESIKNSIVTTGVDNSTDGAPPLSVGGATLPTAANAWTQAGSSATNFLGATYAPYQGSYYKIGDPGSWNGQFEMVANPETPTPNPVFGTVQFEVQPNPADGNSCWPPTPTCTTNKGTVTNDYDYQWTYTYPYEVTVQGQSSGGEAELITEKGTITYSSISGTPAVGTPPSFSRWAAFITNFAPCLGALVPGYMTGPFFTDGQWGFGSFSNPGYTFTGTVGQVSSTTSWFPSSGGCTNSATMPSGMKAPVFDQGFQTGQTAIVAPTNSYNQAQAVLDGMGTPPCTSTPCPVDPAPSATQMNNELKTVSGTAYPSTGTAPTGVYIPYYTNSSGQKVYGSNPEEGYDGAAGGFYVNGNAAITLAATTDSGGNITQTYTITQGSTTTTIVVDNTTGTTTVTSGGSTLTLTGVPQQLDPNTGQVITQTDPSGSVVNPTLVYVNGEITAMQGVVQNDAGITIAATGTVNINGNVTYAQEPVSVPTDTLNTSTNAGVIGIYTPTGNINLSSPYSNNNLEVDGSLAAIGGSCASNMCGFTVSGYINTFNNVGGQIQTNIFSADMSAENTYYDQRFGNNFGPPWFPTGVPQAGATPVPSSQSVLITRTSWQEVNRP